MNLHPHLRHSLLASALLLASGLATAAEPQVIAKELQIVGSRVTLGDYPRALRLMALNKFHPDLLISHEVPLQELQKAFLLLEEKPERYLKVLVKHE